MRFLSARFLAVAAVVAFAPAKVYAQAAPAMWNVREIIVQDSQFSYAKASASCGLEKEELGAALSKTLRDAKVPAFTVATALPPQMGTARINLVSEIASTNTEGLDCTSWVSLSAQTNSTVKIQPIDTLRSVSVHYWRAGTMVVSSQSAHADLVAQALQKMAGEFARQYLADQPPR